MRLRSPITRVRSRPDGHQAQGCSTGSTPRSRLRAAYDLPIIYLTAYADNHTLDRARVTEPYGYVLKPFQERELKAAIEMALQRHGNDQQRYAATKAAALSRRRERAARDDARLSRRRGRRVRAARSALRGLVHDSFERVNDLVPAFHYACPNGDETNGHQRTRVASIESVQKKGAPELHLADPGCRVAGRRARNAAYRHAPRARRAFTDLRAAARTAPGVGALVVAGGDRGHATPEAICCSCRTSGIGSDGARQRPALSRGRARYSHAR